MLERLFLLVAPVSALFGAAAFVCATIYLTLERCSGSCSGFLEGMNRTPGISLSGIVILGVVLAIACVGRMGRGFAAGFFAAFVSLGVATSGDTLVLWSIPSPSAAWRRVAGSPADRKIQRIQLLQTSLLDERPGGVLTYRVLDCIGDERPRLPGQIAVGDCEDLAVSWEGYTGPNRFNADDSGWRWSYAKTAQGFQIDVYPDAILNQTTPEFTADHTGRVTVRRAAGPPAGYLRVP
jgi:hypothetical protein